jgi:hypothetical protein
MTHLICFSHHKGASRLFRFQIFEPLAKRLGREQVRYEALSKLFVFRETQALELYNIRFDLLARSEPSVVMLGNAGPRVVRALKTATSDFRGVHAVRDPRQIFVSGYYHHREGHDILWPGFYWEKLAEDRPQLQRLNLEDGLLYELDNISADVLGQLRGWEDDERVLQVKVEDLAARPEQVLGDVLKFLRVEDGGPLDARNESANPDSQDWRAVFTPRVKKAFKERFNDLLVRYGYEKDASW